MIPPLFFMTVHCVIVDWRMMNFDNLTLTLFMMGDS